MLESRRTILLVLDDPLERIRKKELLESYGYGVQAVTSGREALVWIVENDIDAIVLVGSMAKMGGWDLLETTRWYHRLTQIPALIVSDETVGPWTREAFRFLKQPVSDAALLGAIEAMLNWSHAHPH
jgi:CheY-like chemotaxis protein